MPGAHAREMGALWVLHCLTVWRSPGHPCVPEGWVQIVSGAKVRQVPKDALLQQVGVPADGGCSENHASRALFPLFVFILKAGP